MSPMVFGVIPARYGSTRFPGKPLALVGGIPMVIRVYQRALASGVFTRLVVATDSEEIARVCEAERVPVLLTRADHPSGSDRVYEASRLDPLGQEAELIVNIQGDEPLLEPDSLQSLIAPLKGLSDETLAASLYTRVSSLEDYQNPNIVKLVLDRQERALYFSRAPLPLARAGGLPPRVWRHLGFYAYTRSALELFVKSPVGELEAVESLEQLRLLENGVTIYMREVPFATPAVDTPADLDLVNRLLSEGAGPTR